MVGVARQAPFGRDELLGKSLRDGGRRHVTLKPKKPAKHKENGQTAPRRRSFLASSGAV